MINVLVEGMTEGKGGKEAFIMNTFRAFPKDKYHFSFICYDETIAYQEELDKAGTNIIHVPGRNKGIVNFRKSLDCLFKENHYDIVWANKTTLSSCEILQLAKKNGVPLRIVHSHSSSNMGGKLTFILHHINKVFITRWANELFACSDTAAKWFFGNKPCIQIKNGIDVEKFRFNYEKRLEIRKILGLDESLVIGHIGRFSNEKNHKKLINVFMQIYKKNNSAKLVLCGDGEERDNIVQQIHRLGLDDSVLLLGVVNNVNEILQGVDVVVMPSLFEGLPFALLEAQAAGLPCVVSNTVSKESDVLNWNKFLPLTETDTYWADEILGVDTSIEKRKSAADRMRENGYDVHETVHQIESVFKEYIYS